MSVKLRNLSSNGAFIEGANLPAVGTNVMFSRKGREIRSRVVWVDGDRIGLGFGEDLNVKTALRHVRSIKRLPVSNCRRPGLKSKPLTPGEESFLKRWAAMGVNAPGD